MPCAEKMCLVLIPRTVERCLYWHDVDYVSWEENLGRFPCALQSRANLYLADSWVTFT